jgi:hypothetical protein
MTHITHGGFDPLMLIGVERTGPFIFALRIGFSLNFHLVEEGLTPSDSRRHGSAFQDLHLKAPPAVAEGVRNGPFESWVGISTNVTASAGLEIWGITRPSDVIGCYVQNLSQKQPWMIFGTKLCFDTNPV